MTAPLTLPAHLSSAEISRRYRACADGVERMHWQIVWLLDQGQHVPAVARQLGYTEDWVRTIVHRYIDDGPDGLKDRRRTNPGAKPVVSAAVRAELQTRLAKPPPDGGLWTGPKVAQWLSQRLGRPVAPQRAWEVLRSLGFTLQRPRPTAVHADPAAQDAFKKGGLPPLSGS
jgi:transposase